MRRGDCRGRVLAALLLVVWGLFAPSPPRVLAQAPVIIPGLPGAGLPSGSGPSSIGRPASALPRGKAGAETETTETPYGPAGNRPGARASLFDDGIELRTYVSQFYQGVAGGGLRQAFPYGIKLDYFGTIEGEKLLGWEGLFVNLHGESRFGQSVNRDVGSLIPANFALEFPRPTGSASALTNLQVEQFLGPDFVVTFGKLNAADGVSIHPFLGGNGINRFMNEAFVLSPIYGRAIPYSTPGAGFSYLREDDPLFTFLVLDSSGRPDTSGLSRMFRNGATLFASLRVPVTPFGLPGHQTLETAFATGKSSPLTADDYVILPRPGVGSFRRTGEYVVTYGFDQFLFVEADDPDKGWGIFGNASLANERTNPIRWSLNLGAGGASPLPGRASDSWGLGYYYLGISSVLRDALRPVSPVRNEQGFELYYNAAITGRFALAADVQAIDPARLDAQSSFLFGLRVKVDF